MSEKPPPSCDATTSSGVHHMEKDCDRFEAAWKNARIKGVFHHFRRVE